MAPDNEYALDLDVVEEAARNWNRRETHRQDNRRHLDQKQYVAVESKDRLAKHANRLVRAARQAMPKDPLAMSEGMRELLDREPITEHEVDDLLMERVIGETRDFLSTAFVSKALTAMKSVGRVVRPLGGGGRSSFGTGFLVSPRLLLTNWHVLKTADEAGGASVEFDYQLDNDGRPLPVRRFRLLPGDFFLSDQTLDYALIAVRERADDGTPLSEYGCSPLIGEEGKIILDNCVNIVQHPRGEMKQVVIRENRLIDLLPLHLHYEGDTEPGSSGSPAFNDQWEVVALHHSGVPDTDENGNLLDVDRNVWVRGSARPLAWVANEGVRVSKLVASFRERRAALDAPRQALMDEVLRLGEHPHESTLAPMPAPRPLAPSTSLALAGVPAEGDNAVDSKIVVQDQAASISITIPLTITLSVGAPVQSAVPAGTGTTSAGQAEGEMEAIVQDTDYARRKGYDPEFLGFPVPLPTLRPTARRKAVAVPGAPRSNQYELKYHHYSVILNGERRMAFVAAVNLHGKAPFTHSREGGDRWFFDPRIDRKYQAGGEFYKHNDLDRGHLVRRADAAWGETEEEAWTASDDTFHFTNCSPQDEVFNQAKQARQRGLNLWGNLEEHIAAQARRDNQKLCIFNGPVFGADDRAHRGLRIPAEYWKLIVFEKAEGKPVALAFLLSQSALIADLPEEAMDFPEFRTFQIPVRDLESLTLLDFGNLRDHDPLEDGTNESYLESGAEFVALESLDALIL